MIELNIILYRYDKLYSVLKNQNSTDTYIYKFIRNLICNITKLKKNNIIEIYNDSVKKSDMEDKFIINWIQNTLEILQKIDKSSNISPNNEISNNSSNNNDKTNENKNDEQKTEENKNEEKDENSKGNNTIDQLKKKWNDVKQK